MSDPLSIIRQATIAKTPFVFADGAYDFGHVKLPADLKTCFKRTLKNDDYLYSVKDIMFFLEHGSLSFSDYRRKVVEANDSKLSFVTTSDMPHLLAFLNGTIETCPNIDSSAAQPFVPATDATVSKPAKSKAPKEDKKRTEGEEKEKQKEKSEKPHKEHKRKHETISSSFSDLDKTAIDADKPVLARLRTGEFAPFSRGSIFNIDQPGVDFSSVLKVFNDSVLKPKDKDGEKTASSGSGDPSKATASVAKSPAPYRTPIILVPKAITSEINILNIKQFLEQGKFSQPQQTQQKPKVEVVSRVSPLNSSKRLQYKVMDDPSAFVAEDWERVIAVFVTGQVWQFKGWKYPDPVNLFQHALGVHIVADQRATDPTIASWNCKVLKVSSFKDHVTTSASQDFWTALDQFTRYRKPQFDPSNAK